MSYLNSATIIGFVGADPEQRQARNNNGSKFTVLSVATQRSWKNTDDEWASKTEWHRVCVFRPRLTNESEIERLLEIVNQAMAASRGHAAQLKKRGATDSRSGCRAEEQARPGDCE